MATFEDGLPTYDHITNEMWRRVTRPDPLAKLRWPQPPQFDRSK